MISKAIRKSTKAVIPYITAGLPDLDTTGEILRVLCDAGAPVIEIGLPFSDPMADGPILQKASQQALESGFTLDGLFDHLGKWSSGINSPLIVMSYINPIMRRGISTTFAIFKEKGISGVIIPDIPSSASEIYGLCDNTGLDLIRLLAPATTRQRQKEVLSQCSGFAYAVSVKGVTGARTALPEEVHGQVKTIKAMTDLPVCVGFGVSTASQVRDLLGVADGVIVGSHLMDQIMRASDPVKAADTAYRALLPPG